MDGTVGENRQSAAAVAANADTKATSVKLIIKSSNQQYADQTIESDMLWSIKRLKMHLQTTHPSKPPVAEQKLIYSGQLLSEQLLLKDVLRSYKDVYTQNHIIHLVYTPKVDTVKSTIKPKPQTASSSTNMAATTATEATATSTLRQRPVAAQQQTQTQQQQQQQQPQQQQQQYANFGTQFMPQVGSPACPPFYGQNSMPFNIQLMATQQNVMQQWMQQVYSQYMDQYARFSSANGVNDNNATTTATTASVGMPWPTNAFMPFMSFNPGSMPYPVIPPTTFLAATPTVSTNVNEQSAAPQAATPEAAENAENEREAAAAAAAAPAEPRFPLIAAEEADNRDWLDSFFAITRLAIFLTIMYFNSTPMRCLAVVLIASFIYLYHNGVLRFNRERNNNNINRNNNAQVPAAPAAAAEPAQPRNEEEDTSSNDDDSEETDTADESNATVTATPAAQAVITTSANENSSSFMSTVQTFVITFFTSLLPETPAVN